MGKSLREQRGCIVEIRISKTYNLKAAGLSEDARDLGVFVSYIGAGTPDGGTPYYSYDPYTIRRIEFPCKYEDIEKAVHGFYAPEDNGMWAGHHNTINLRDGQIEASGLKIVYQVPHFLIGLDSMMEVLVDGELVFELVLSEEGTFAEVIDIGLEEKEAGEYLQKAHRILKLLLADFDRVCTKYGLHYYLICGSLLGAVRHGDFIPWDDDVDVAMPRRDFDILLKHVNEEWGEDKDIIFLNYNQMGNHAFLDYMTRIIYMKEEIPVNVFKKIRGKGRADVDNHMPMDIYVLDNASDNEFFHNFQTQFIRGLYGLAMGHRAYINPEDYMNRDSKTQKIVKTLSTIGKCIPLSWILGCYEWVRKWNKNKKCDNYFESNGFIYCIPWKFRQCWFGEGTRMAVGDLEVTVPQDYKAFLKVHYADYTQYPPMEARKPTHSVEASGIF